MDVVTEYIWVLWIALVLVFVIIEMLSLEFTFLMLAIGALGGLVADLLGAEIWLQVLVAAGLSVALLAFLRPSLLHALKKGADPALSNVDALIGLAATVVVASEGSPRQVKLGNGETWTARVSPLVDADLRLGDRVVVTAIDGSTAVVVPAERRAAGDPPSPLDPTGRTSS